MAHKTRRTLWWAGVLTLLVVGIVLKLDLFAAGSNLYAQVQRFMEVVQAVNKFYFDEVDPGDLIDGAISGLLEQLDPHSVYIPADQVPDVQSEFDGEFEGIGIEFVVHDKTPLIISAIAGSPAERVGLRSGDKIVRIEGKPTYGLSEEGIRRKLVGHKGTEVNLQVERQGLEEPFEVRIVRDLIPIQSVVTALMLDGKTAYIRVGRFAKTTDNEFTNALYRLAEAGMKQLILDLRDNSGGYLEQAVEMADKFLDADKRIVYTRGRIPGSSEDYYSTGTGLYANVPLIVMINHGSASASEIVAGAMQDWDRGLILGTTSFGKGLVQHQVALKDGAAVRITIARYHTPSGRVIQRPYDRGIESYVEEGYDDEDANANADSTRGKPVFKTNTGRKVYGGGGITPDVSIPSGTISAATIKMLQQQLLFDYAGSIAKRKHELGKSFAKFQADFTVTPKMLKELTRVARTRGLSDAEEALKRDGAFIRRRLKSQLALHFWGSKAYHEIETREDPEVQEAVKHFPEAAEIAGLTLE